MQFNARLRNLSGYGLVSKSLAIISLITILLFFANDGHAQEGKGVTGRAGKDFALFFAVNQYDSMRPLNRPVRDAEAIAKELEAYYGFRTEVVKDPTLDEMEQKLKLVQQEYAAGRLASDGQLLVFFTGHGMVENKNGFFLAKDSDPEKLPRTAWAYAYWRPFLNSINCKHILVVIDACYSGTFDPDWWGKGDFGRPGTLSEGEYLLVEHEKYKTRMFFTSATEVQSPDDSNFAKKFLAALRSRGGSDGILTSTELFSYLEQARPKPHYGNFGDYDPGSGFLFILQNPLDKGLTNQEETKAMEMELQAWRAARDADTIGALKAYLEQFPNGAFRGAAIIRIQELEQEAANHREELTWEFAEEKANREGYLAYLNEYPDGKYSGQATQWLQRQRAEEMQRQAEAEAQRRVEEEKKKKLAGAFGSRQDVVEGPGGDPNASQLEHIATAPGDQLGGLMGRRVV